MKRQLPRNRVLAALSPGDLDLLRPEDVDFSRGEILFDSNGRVDQIYFPHTALVSLLTHLKEGGTIETGTVGYEGIVGAFAIYGDNVALSRSMVQIPGRCGVVPLNRMKKAVSESKSIRMLLGHFQQAFAAHLLQQVACNVAHDVLSRCARWILMGLDRTEGDVVPLTHEFLGEMLGTVRPTVSVALKELQKAGLIETSYARIRVLDRSGLTRASCECYRNIRDIYNRLLPNTYR
jgi:CRP-like cAMP-binding protein